MGATRSIEYARACYWQVWQYSLAKFCAMAGAAVAAIRASARNSSFISGLLKVGRQVRVIRTKGMQPISGDSWQAA
jgi:hypothetical protein